MPRTQPEPKTGWREPRFLGFSAAVCALPRRALTYGCRKVPPGFYTYFAGVAESWQGYLFETGPQWHDVEGCLKPETLKSTFASTEMPRIRPVEGHTHPFAAAYRNSGRQFALDWAFGTGRLPLFMCQMSPRDARDDMIGSHRAYWSKDAQFDEQLEVAGDMAHLTDLQRKRVYKAISEGATAQQALEDVDDIHYDTVRDPSEIEVMVDVDPYCDMHDLLTEPKTRCIYTFQPENVGQDGVDDSCFTFIDNTLNMRVAGGADYAHKVWNYAGDSLTVGKWKKKRGNWIHYNIYVEVSYLVERRRVAAHRYVIALIPTKMRESYVGPDPDRLHRRLSRLEVKDGEFNRLYIVDPKGKMLVSTAREGDYFSATVRQSTDATLLSMAKHANVTMTVPATVSWMDDQSLEGKKEACTLRDFGVMAAKRLVQFTPDYIFWVGEGIRTYRFPDNGLFLDDATTKMVTFMKPFVNGLFAPILNRAAEERSIVGRVQNVKHTEKMKKSGFLKAELDNFVKLFVNGTVLHPCEHEEVFDKQKRPSQRRILEDACNQGEPTKSKKTRNHMKVEAKNKLDDPRNISQVESIDKLGWSRFMYPLGDYLKTMPWYAFGMSPIEVAEQVMEICTSAENDAPPPCETHETTATTRMWVDERIRNSEGNEGDHCLESDSEDEDDEPWRYKDEIRLDHRRNKWSDKNYWAELDVEESWKDYENDMCQKRRPASNSTGSPTVNGDSYFTELKDYLEVCDNYGYGIEDEPTLTHEQELERAERLGRQVRAERKNNPNDTNRPIRYATLTDLDKMDGRVSDIARELEEAICLALFPNYRDEVYKYLRSQYGIRGVGTFGTRYDTGWSRLSGSPETSAFNTILSAFIAYLALRMTRKADGTFIGRDDPREAWDALGIYGGDDGFTMNVPMESYRNAAKMVGQVLTVEIVREGEQGVKFLSRVYSPYVWWGATDSMCDLLRILKKFHGTGNLPPGVTPVHKLIEKCRGFELTDPNTPVIGRFANAVSKLARGASLKATENDDYGLRSWWSHNPRDVQFPNGNVSNWMEAYIAEFIPGLDVRVFNKWMDDYAPHKPSVAIEDMLEVPLLHEVEEPRPGKATAECEGRLFEGTEVKARQSSGNSTACAKGASEKPRSTRQLGKGGKSAGSSTRTQPTGRGRNTGVGSKRSTGGKGK